jgi:hypothetical protein
VAFTGALSQRPETKAVTSSVAMCHWFSAAFGTAAISMTLSPVEPGEPRH